MSTHFYYDGRRKYYTKDEWYENIGNYQFKEEVAKLFQEFSDDAVGLVDSTPQELIEQYHLEMTGLEEMEEDEALPNVVDDGYFRLMGCYGIYSFDRLIKQLKEYSLAHRAFAELLDEWAARTEYQKSKTPVEKHKAVQGAGPIEDPALMHEGSPVV